MLRKVTPKKVMKPSARAMRVAAKRPKSPMGTPQDAERVAGIARMRCRAGVAGGDCRHIWKALSARILVMGHTAQTELLPAAQVARETPVQQAENGICYATFGDHKLPSGDLEQVIGAVPRDLAAALKHRAYYFVPLTIHEQDGDSIPDDAHSSGETLIAPQFTTELSDRAICHRNVHFAGADYIFISTRLMQDKFALAFELFINIGHHFVDAAGVPASFGELVDRQAMAQVRGETSHDAWESRERAYGELRVEGAERGRGAAASA